MTLLETKTGAEFSAPVFVSAETLCQYLIEKIDQQRNHCRTDHTVEH